MAPRPECSGTGDRNASGMGGRIDRYIHFLTITVSLPSLRLAQSLPGEKPPPRRSNKPCALSSSVLWPKTTPSPLRELSFRSPRNLPIAPTPTRESMCMSFCTARWNSSTNKKNSRAAIQNLITHLAYIERTASGRGSAMDPLRGIRTNPLNSHPDILSLLLP